jgi:hypothetical protein
LTGGNTTSPAARSTSATPTTRNEDTARPAAGERPGRPRRASMCATSPGTVPYRPELRRGSVLFMTVMATRCLMSGGGERDAAIGGRSAARCWRQGRRIRMGDRVIKLYPIARRKRQPLQAAIRQRWRAWGCRFAVWGVQRVDGRWGVVFDRVKAASLRPADARRSRHHPHIGIWRACTCASTPTRHRSLRA